MTAEASKAPQEPVKPYEDFPAPESRTIALFGDKFIVIKKRLTIGEERRARQRMYIPNYQTGQLLIDPTMSGMTTVLAYLIDWNLVRGGERVQIRDLALAAETDEAKVKELQKVVEQLDPATYDAIEAAVKAHEKAEDEARENVKKALGGGLSSSATASSPSGPAGPLNTSEASAGKITKG